MCKAIVTINEFKFQDGLKFPRFILNAFWMRKQFYAVRKKVRVMEQVKIANDPFY